MATIYKGVITDNNNNIIHPLTQGKEIIDIQDAIKRYLHSGNAITIKNLVVRGDSYFATSITGNSEIAPQENSLVLYAYYNIPDYQNVEDVALYTNFTAEENQDMHGAFMECNKLVQLVIPHWSAKQVTDLHDFVKNNYKLQLVDLTGWDLSNVTSFRRMFFNCNELAEIEDISTWNTANATDMAFMFAGCKVLPYSVYNFNTSNVEDMSYMFLGVITPNTIDLTSFDTSKVTNMEGTFAGSMNVASWDADIFTVGDNKVTLLDLSSFNTSNVTNMRSLFQGRVNDVSSNKWMTVKFGDNWDTTNVKDMSHMFYDAYTVNMQKDGTDTKIDPPEFIKDYCNTSNVEDMSYMFYHVLKSDFDLSNVDVSKVKNMAYMFAQNLGATSYNFTGWDTSNVEDMSFMFAENMNDLANKMTGLESLNTSNVKNMSGMFYGMQYMSGVPGIANWDVSNVEDMSYMFAGDTNRFQNIPVENWNTASLKNAQAMFCCVGKSNDTDSTKRIPLLDLSGWDLSKVTNVTSMFGANADIPGRKNWTMGGFVNVSKLLLPNTINPEITSFKHFLSGLSYCEELTLPDFSNCHNVVDTSYMFGASNSGYGGVARFMQAIELPNFNLDTSKVTTMENMFHNSNVKVPGNYLPDMSSAINIQNACHSLQWIDEWQGDFNFTAPVATKVKGAVPNIPAVNNALISYPQAEDCSLLMSGGSLDTNGNVSGGYIKTIDSKYLTIDLPKATDLRYAFNQVVFNGRVVFNLPSITDKTNLGGMFNTAKPATKALQIIIPANIVALFADKDEFCEIAKVSAQLKPYIFFEGEEEIPKPGEVTSMSYYARDNIPNYQTLTNIDAYLPESTAKVTDFSGAFAGCEELTSLDFSKIDTSSAIYFNNMFADCDKLTDFDFSTWDMSKVTTVQDMFYHGGTGDINSFVGFTAKPTMWEYAFERCHIHCDITLDFENVTALKNMQLALAGAVLDDGVTVTINNARKSKLYSVGVIARYIYTIYGTPPEGWADHFVVNWMEE